MCVIGCFVERDLQDQTNCRDILELTLERRDSLVQFVTKDSCDQTTYQNMLKLIAIMERKQAMEVKLVTQTLAKPACHHPTVSGPTLVPSHLAVTMCLVTLTSKCPNTDYETWSASYQIPHPGH